MENFNGGLLSSQSNVPGFDRIDAHELSVLHLHADQARADDLAPDVGAGGGHAVGVEVVDVADRGEQVRPG